LGTSIEQTKYYYVFYVNLIESTIAFLRKIDN